MKRKNITVLAAVVVMTALSAGTFARAKSDKQK